MYTFGALSNGFPLYAYHDQVGSIRAWRLSNKNLLGRNDFDPYGWTYNKYASLPVDFALHAQDPYTLLYHAPYREYAGGWCRWTTRDPLGMVDGPNMFAYVGDGPTVQVDPLGQESWECTKGYINCLRSRPSGENKQNCKACAKGCQKMGGKWPTASKKCGPGPNPQIPTVGTPCPADEPVGDPQNPVDCSTVCSFQQNWIMRYTCLILCLGGWL